MSVRITVYDGMNPMLEQIALVSVDAALDCLDYAGTKLRGAARAELEKRRTPWNKFLGKNGQMQLRFDPKNKQQLGLRFSSKTAMAVSPSSMSSFISSYLDERNLLMVVGGRHKRGAASEFRDGRRTGSYHSYDGIGTASFAILHMMNTGEEIEGWPKGILPPEKRQGYRFMQSGYNAARGDILNAMTNRYQRLIYRNSANAPITKIKKVIA